MEDGAEKSETFDVLTKRTGILERLVERPAHVRDLVEELDQSRSTISRALDDLEDVDLVERTGEGYTATIAGRLALDRFVTFQAELDDLVTAESVVTPLPAETSLDTAAIAGSEAVLATDPAPYRPLERFHDDLAEADRYRAVLPALADPRHVRLLYEHVLTRGRPAELVVSPELFDTLRAEFPRQMAGMADTEEFRLLVADVPPFALALVDTDGDATALYLVVFTENAGVHGTLVNGTPDAVRWGEQRYAEIKETAEDRTGALLPDADGGSTVDADGGAVRGALGRSLSVPLEREGFVRLGVSYFRDQPVANPATAWRAGLSLPEVHTGYAVERTQIPGDEGTGEETDQRRDGETARRLTDSLTATLEAGSDCVVVGPPGSGKSTLCKRVACAWYDEDRGPVLYREGGRGRSFLSVSDLVVTVDAAEGHSLVVVEDAVRTEAEAVFKAIDRLGDRDDVSFLLDARRNEWRDPPGTVTAVPGSDLDVVHMPPLDDAGVQRLIERFERTIGEPVDVPTEQLREAVRDGTTSDTAAAPDEVLLLLHRLATYADPLADGPTSLEEEVAAVYDELADETVTLDVAVLANVLNATGAVVDAAALYAVADADEFDAVDAAIDRLEGRVLFARDDGTYRTVHEAWSVAFLANLLESEGEATAAGRFGRCVSRLLSLADDADRRRRIASHLPEELSPGPITDDPGTWADDVVEAVYALGRERPKLAPLYRADDGDDITLPDACSEEVVARRPVWLSEAFEAGGYLDAARETAREGLARRGEDTREACELLGALARAQTDQGDYDSARETAERQQEMAAALDARRFEGEALHQLGAVARRQGEYEQARDSLEASLAIARECGDQRTTATIHRELGTTLWYLGEYDEARDCFQRSLELFRAIGDRRGEAKALGNLGIVAHRESSYGECREYYERSLAIKRAIGARQGESKTLMNLGLIAARQGEYGQAREYNEKSLAIKREIGDRQGEARALNNLGRFAAEQGEYDRAREYGQESLAIFRDIDDSGGVASAIENLGTFHAFQGAYEQAREYCEDGLAMFREVGDRQGEAASLVDRGIVAMQQGGYEQAREYYEESLAITREIGDRQAEALALTRLGTVALGLGAEDRAREHYEESLEIARDIGVPRREGPNLLGLGAVARRQGNPEQARTHLDRALSLFEEMGQRLYLARTRLEASRLALETGDTDRARERAETARATFAAIGATHWEARSRQLLGRVAAAADDPGTAREHWRTALEVFEEVGAVQDALATLGSLAERGCEVGDDGPAVALHQRATELLNDAPGPVVDRHREWLEQGTTGRETD